MKVLTSVTLSKVFRRLTSSAFIAVLSLALISLSLNGCAQQSLSTHVYTSDTDGNAKHPTLLEKQPTLGDKQPVSSTKQFTVGAERYSKYLPLLAGKRVSLVVNQSALVSSHSALPSSTVEPEERESSNSLATQKK